MCSVNISLTSFRADVKLIFLFTCRLVDPNNLYREVKAGEQGIILARGPGVTAGYWRDPKATDDAFFDGFYNTGASPVPPLH